jgi:hypothetical protein
MKAFTWFAAGAVLFGATGCAFGKKQPVNISADRQRAANNWTARLATPPGMQGALQVEGIATIAPGDNNNESIVEVHLSNVAPGGVHPWKVQTGQCGTEGSDLVKVTDDGRMLKVSSSGRADASAKVTGVPMPTAGDYAIVVMAAPDNQEMVIACGNFAPPPSNATSMRMQTS